MCLKCCLCIFSTNETIIKKSQQESGRDLWSSGDLWRQPCLFLLMWDLSLDTA